MPATQINYSVDIDQITIDRLQELCGAASKLTELIEALYVKLALKCQPSIDIKPSCPKESNTNSKPPIQRLYEQCDAALTQALDPHSYNHASFAHTARLQLDIIDTAIGQEYELVVPD
ncbi:hypothetical protein FACS1894184_14060 [Clostridia bacterium]|nr:hypothetical protein FACS1894184_14060 [Clostridia bacterium]